MLQWCSKLIELSCGYVALGTSLQNIFSDMLKVTSYRVEIYGALMWTCWTFLCVFFWCQIMNDNFQQLFLKSCGSSFQVKCLSVICYHQTIFLHLMLIPWPSLMSNWHAVHAYLEEAGAISLSTLGDGGEALPYRLILIFMKPQLVYWAAHCSGW